MRAYHQLCMLMHLRPSAPSASQVSFACCRAGRCVNPAAPGPPTRTPAPDRGIFCNCMGAACGPQAPAAPLSPADFFLLKTASATTTRNFASYKCCRDASTIHMSRNSILIEAFTWWGWKTEGKHANLAAPTPPSIAYSVTKKRTVEDMDDNIEIDPFYDYQAIEAPGSAQNMPRKPTKTAKRSHPPQAQGPPAWSSQGTTERSSLHPASAAHIGNQYGTQYDGVANMDIIGGRQAMVSGHITRDLNVQNREYKRRRWADMDALQQLINTIAKTPLQTITNTGSDYDDYVIGGRNQHRADIKTIVRNHCMRAVSHLYGTGMLHAGDLANALHLNANAVPRLSHGV